ncbi:alkaline phosphatase D family protein [Paucibacter sp. Y2R2-4]|uniref:alkaline phosphatase D family protein n=1 Tax=Paucibacter sp. Y2R2-4 TaxID=2893553 RepID=UPI0021E492B5|nr:alkaline phosphatase D family protein [Paucibacter sp. Y2R2-4]MCV2351279.1 alkaline phosphatase D family protein [Paucibacter sp. Y2R2-4]
MNELPPQSDALTEPDTQAGRRDFVRQSLALVASTSAVLGTLSLSACGGSPAPTPPPPPPAPPPPSSISFSHGVASGDPLKDRLMLWTRVIDTQDSAASLSVRWEVALDADFKSLVSSGEALASADKDHTVKVDAGSLQPGQKYFYRFTCKGQTSPTGRSKTLPKQTERVKLAVFSCANYPSGFFNAYAEAAKRDDLDAAVHLGDYLYEYGRGDYGDAGAKALGREVEPANEALSLNDYRRRYAQYRSDPDLRALHAALPMIAVWDDHEVCDDAWSGGGLNHQPASEGAFATRKAAAIQAYHEWLPIRTGTKPDEIYRSFAFGDLLALHMLDTRLIGREQQLSYNSFRTGSAFDSAGFEAQLKRADRQLLGETQHNWLRQQMANSNATWQVLGQQVLMTRMKIPAALRFEFDAPGSGLSPKAYAELLLKAQLSPATLTEQERTWLALPALPLNLDAWDGYDTAREALLASAQNLNKNLVVLAGDSHNAWASNLADRAGTAVGVEFATASVSSPGIESYLGPDAAALLSSLLSQLNGSIAFANVSQRGFMVITATAQECLAEWVFVSNIASRSYSADVGHRLKVLPGAGQRSLKSV